MVMKLKSVDISEFMSDRSAVKPKVHLLDGKTAANEMLNKLSEAERIVYAEEDDKVLGVYCYSRAKPGNPCFCQELLDIVGPDAVIALPMNIYVRPEYRGQGLVNTLQRWYTDDAAARGFTHSVGFLPETDNIKAWAEKQTNLTLLRGASAKGNWMTVRKLR